MMIEEYCSRIELRAMKQEIWDSPMKGDDFIGYTNRFHELALLCPTMIEPEHKKIERYIQGLSPEILRNVALLKPASMHEAIRMAHKVMGQDVQNRNARVINNPDCNSNKREWNSYFRYNNN